MEKGGEGLGAVTRWFLAGTAAAALTLGALYAFYRPVNPTPAAVAFDARAPSVEEIAESAAHLKVYPTGSPLKLGEPVPDFEVMALPRTDEQRSRVAEPFRLSELEGIVVLDFGIPGCGPCDAMDRELERIYGNVRESATFIKIISRTSPDGLNGYLRENTFPYPVVYDADGGVTASYGVDGFPYVFVLEDMLLVRRTTGFGKRTGWWLDEHVVKRNRSGGKEGTGH